MLIITLYLFVMDSKYADVLSVKEVIEFLESLPAQARDTVEVEQT